MALSEGVAALVARGFLRCDQEKTMNNCYWYDKLFLMKTFDENAVAAPAKALQDVLSLSHLMLH